ncbi:complex I NDUFA9 subunit family protein [Palleronia sp. LCG004]|uniref:complex I NDUFA9 subunit family protein n=1 Tax=Palleronia sp. LCG004 TaxID=3079304 RepID=UPI002941ECAD|nr:complex I NDUFA9 subunit family protein [Palleronia sp. LCG004]WOI56398.1 complex I NDUFA9 subunit family protein [Palleronia sp. LCG004]
MAKIVTILGGSGFVGRYVAQRMAARGWRVRVACRHINNANFVRLYGVVGQVEPVFCNIRDDASVREVTRAADAVVNCVGILAESRRQSFEALQSEGAARIARIAAEEGVEKLVQISAIGADEDSPSEYARTKAQGEAAVREAFPGAVILRPSIIFGSEDEFFNRFASMAARSPVLPLVNGKVRFQPVWVDDVAQAVERALTSRVEPGIYELGGPDVRTFRELMEEMLDVIRRRRLIVSSPIWAGRIMGGGFDLVGKLTGGLISGPLTRDQVDNLSSDNVVGDGARTFADLGIEPTATEAVLPGYLWRFRRSGQYSDIKESARRLRSRQE